MAREHSYNNLIKISRKKEKTALLFLSSNHSYDGHNEDCVVGYFIGQSISSSSCASAYSKLFLMSF